MNLSETLKRRDEQIKRVIAALANDPKDKAIEILCMWMDIDSVDAMLKTIERK